MQRGKCLSQKLLYLARKQPSGFHILRQRLAFKSSIQVCHVQVQADQCWKQFLDKRRRNEIRRLLGIDFTFGIKSKHLKNQGQNSSVDGEDWCKSDWNDSTSTNCLAVDGNPVDCAKRCLAENFNGTCNLIDTVETPCNAFTFQDGVCTLGCVETTSGNHVI